MMMRPSGRPLLVAGVLLAVLAVQGDTARQAVKVRLHHLHFLSTDVSESLAETVRRLGGSRVLLQGLGVGVRLETGYLLFDHGSAIDAEPGVIDATVPVSDAELSRRYRAALRWLAARGVEAAPADVSREWSAAGHALDHIAFAATNLDAAVQPLLSSGERLLRRTSDSAFFRGEGVVIEITRDTDLPDVLWCPMHPDVRAATPGTCPICSMDLVPIPPPRLGQYPVDVHQTAGAGRRGTRSLSLRIRDPESGKPITALVPLHERLLHLFVIGRDLRFFAHEHPVQKGDTFELAIDLAPGSYLLVADFLPAGGSPQTVHRVVVTPGSTASPFAPAPRVAEDTTDKIVDGLRVRLAVDGRPGRLDTVLRFSFSDVKTAAPVQNLQPYLGASGHLLIVSADLAHAIHAHPEDVSSGPEVRFGAEFPAPGLYKVWVQVQRESRVLTAPFVIKVGSS